MLKRTPNPVPAPSVPAPIPPQVRFPEEAIPIRIGRMLAIEYTSDSLRVYGFAFVAANFSIGRQTYQPPRISLRQKIELPETENFPKANVVISRTAADFRMICGRLRVMVQPTERLIEVWNARYVDVIIGQQAVIRLSEERSPLPNFTREDLFPEG